MQTVNFQSSVWFPRHFLAAERKQKSCLWGSHVLSVCSEDLNKNQKGLSSAERAEFFLLKRQWLCFGCGKCCCLLHLERYTSCSAPVWHEDVASTKKYLWSHLLEIQTTRGEKLQNENSWISHIKGNEIKLRLLLVISEVSPESFRRDLNKFSYENTLKK